MDELSDRRDAIRYNLLLAGLILVLFLMNFYAKTLFFHPVSTHQWRQADCLSIAKNYYEEGMHFFQPKIHYQGPIAGKAVSELPILNYTAAALWKVFGEHEFIYRLLEYLIYLTGIFMLFNTIGTYLRSWLLAFFAVFFLLTSPLLTYYSLNFIADVPALSISIISLCLFFRFYFNQKNYLFYLALFTGTLAVLMKASALMPLGLLYFFTLLDLTRLNRYARTRELFSTWLFPALSVLLSLSLIIGWYRWALAYNLNNTNTVFLLTVLPMWEMQEADIIATFKILCNDLFPVFLNRPMFFLFFIVVFYIIGNFKKLSAFFKYAFVFSALYFIVYLLFFFQVFTVHDYYLNNLMIFPVIALMAFADLIVKGGQIIPNRAFIRLFLVVTFIFNCFFAAASYRNKMIEDDVLTQWYPFISKDERKNAKYYFWDYSNSIRKLEEIRPILRKHGIQREEQVLCIPDQSFNISLYFMDQKGHCISREHFLMDSTVTRHFRNKGIRYLVMSDTTLILQPAFRQMNEFVEPFFTSGPVKVWKVKPGF